MRFCRKASGVHHYAGTDRRRRPAHKARPSAFLAPPSTGSGRSRRRRISANCCGRSTKLIARLSRDSERDESEPLEAIEQAVDGVVRQSVLPSSLQLLRLAFERRANKLDLLVAQMLDADELARAPCRPRAGVRRAWPGSRRRHGSGYSGSGTRPGRSARSCRVDHQLPRVRIMEDRAGNGPDDAGGDGADERARLAHPDGGFGRDVGKELTHGVRNAGQR